MVFSMLFVGRRRMASGANFWHQFCIYFLMISIKSDHNYVGEIEAEQQRMFVGKSSAPSVGEIDFSWSSEIEFSANKKSQ